MAFLCGKDVFTLLSTDFVKSLVEHRGALELTTGQWNASSVIPCVNRKPHAVAACQ